MQMTVRIILIGIFIFLTGCATRPKPALTPISPQTAIAPAKASSQSKNHLEKVAQISHWEAQGRLAASKASKGGNASFVWTQHGEHYQIKLFGPFGAGAVYISGNQQQVEIREANGKKTKAASAEEALQKKAGWTVPISGLHYWLVGMPIPGQAIQTQKLDAAGRLLMLNQKGWTIHYEGYSEDNGVALPTKLKLQNGAITVKMVIKSWKPLSAP